MRSKGWFANNDFLGFAHRSWMKNQGLPDDVFDGRPVIGICNTWSELTPCNAHLRELADHVKRGVLEAGGLPLEFPVMSLGETVMRPTTMLFRNLCSMDVEESIRANPLDGVVLMAGCDKTTPALLMGAASCDLPTIVVSGGPMLSGRFRDEPIGSGTHLFKFMEMAKSGDLSFADLREAEAGMSRSAGSCMTMGTASTMALIAEALGVALPQNGSIPAVDSRRRVLARQSGRQIVKLTLEGRRLSSFLTRSAFENAIAASSALGGSTNAVVHLLAIAGRLGVPLDLRDWDRFGDIPCLVDLLPSGKHLMEDFFYAGGLPAVLREIAERLDLGAATVGGVTLGSVVADAPNWNTDVIRPLSNPVTNVGGIAVLFGNLAPNGAVIKPSAATPALMKHRGVVIAFDDLDDYRRRAEDPALAVDENSVIVVKNCGPRGFPGFPEVGNFSLPSRLLKKGIRDLVRISDARMSGTAYGTAVLHVSPEAAVGGPLALVRSGDVVQLDVAARRLHLEVSDEALAERRASWSAKPQSTERGWVRMYEQHVLQADRGADLDFLVGGSGAAVPRPGH